MEYTQIELARDDFCATLTFNRPEQLNALSPTLIAEALHAVESVAASDARVLVITGRGRSFSAGVDVKEVAKPTYTRDDSLTFSAKARKIARQFETMRQVTIAQVAGHCYTGGLELALGCDFILAADDAIFADTHTRLGMRAGWGLSQRLPRRIGIQRAREMSFTARKVTAAEAVRWGLALRAVPRAELETSVAELAAAVAENSGDAIAAYKTLFRYSHNAPLDAGLLFEAENPFDLRDRSSRIQSVAKSLGGGDKPN